jgi:predicted RNA-binding protein YlqC (UPF0109 family)
MGLSQEKRVQAVETLGRMLELLGIQAEITDASHDDVAVLNVKTDHPGRLIGRKGVYLQSLELLLNRMVQKRGEDFTPIHIDVDGGKNDSRDPEARERSERIRAERAQGGGRGPRPPREQGPGEEGEVRDEGRGERRNDRGERGDRFERGGRGDRPERGDRFDRGPRPPRESGSAPAAGPSLDRVVRDAAKEVRLWGEPKTLGPFTSGERREIHAILKDVAGVFEESGPDLGDNRKTITIRPGERPSTAAGAEG